ncbi:MAG: NADH-quinone oxidoreductase subunit L [Actinomycetes bacterium]
MVLLPLAAGAVAWPVGGALQRRGHAVGRPLGVAVGSVVALLLPLAVAAAVRPAATTLVWGGGLMLELSAAGVAGVLAVLVPFVAAPVIVFAGYHEDEDGAPRLLGLMAAFVGSMQLLVLAADLLGLLIAWELVGALSWSLIGVGWRDMDNPRRAAHAFNATRLGGIGLVLAAGAAFAGTGSLSYAALGELSGPLLDVVAGGVLVAAAAKSAQLPFAPWLYSAMAGPTPVSALLHSATMVAAGAYALIRLEPVLAATDWFGPATVVLGLATALAGGATAAVEDHGKRALAASTSSQYGLMFVAVGAGVPGAAAAHLVAHALFKALLFLGVGVGIHAVGDPDIHRMRLGRALPRVAGAFAVGSLALAAVPPLGGAWTKDAVVAAGFHASAWVGGLTLVAGFLSAIYATRLFLLAFGRRDVPRPVADGRLHAPAAVETAVLWVFALASVLLGLLWLPGGAGAVRRLTGFEVPEAALWELVVAVALISAAAGWVAVQVRRTGAATLGLPPGVRHRIAGWYGLPEATRVVVVDPFLRLCRRLGQVDDVAVDGAVGAVAGAARRASALLSRWAELGVDGAVRLIAGAAGLASRTSAVADDRRVDGAVEGLAAAVGDAGRRARGLQTGLSHHYYLLMTVGVVVLVATVAIWR